MQCSFSLKLVHVNHFLFIFIFKITFKNLWFYNNYIIYKISATIIIDDMIASFDSKVQLAILYSHTVMVVYNIVLPKYRKRIDTKNQEKSAFYYWDRYFFNLLTSSTHQTVFWYFVNIQGNKSFVTISRYVSKYIMNVPMFWSGRKTHCKLYTTLQ